MKLTLKQEAFCQAYIENGGNASEAYRTAYDVKTATDKSVNELSSVLLKNVKVASRVKQLRAEIEERHKLTVDDLIAELEQARTEAYNLNTPQLAAAISATMGKAKMLGYLSDKVEISGTLKMAVTVSDEQAKRIAREVLGGD